MPLIIETYFTPYTKIAELMFEGIEFTYIDRPVSEPADEEMYCYTREEGSREIKYYFNKIYYIENGKIVCIHKTAKQIKYYDEKTGKLINFQKERKDEEALDKTEFLPQLRAQDGELVIFPEEDDEI